MGVENEIFIGRPYGRTSKTIRLNAFVSTLTWELEKSYRVASIAGGPVAS